MKKITNITEQISLAKKSYKLRIVENASLKLGEILDREKLSSDAMYELYNTLLTAIRFTEMLLGSMIKTSKKWLSQSYFLKKQVKQNNQCSIEGRCPPKGVRGD